MVGRSGPGRLASGLCALAMVAGCAGAPAAPAVTLPAAWANAGAPAGHPLPAAGFWNALGDGRLAALVERSLRGNPGVAQAGERIAAARALRSAADARFLPELGLAGNARIRRFLVGQQFDSASLGGLLPGGASFGQPRTIGSYEAGFDASWELGLFGRSEAARAGALAEVAVAEAEAAAVRTSLAAEVGRTYAALRAAEAREHLLLAVAASQDRLAALVRQRRAAGIASEAEVVRVAGAPDRSRAQAAEARAAARRALHRLATLAGEAAADPTLPIGADAARRQPRVPPDLAARILAGALPADLLRVRPDIRRAEATVLRAGAEAGLARAELWPRLALGGTLTVSGTPLGSSAFSPAGPLVVGGFGPSVTVPLLDWGRRRATVGARDAEFRAAAEGYRQSVLEGVEEAEVALSNARAARDRALLLERSAGQGAEAVRLADIAYRAGLGSLLERLEAEAAWLGARLDLVAAQEEELVAVVALHKALGGAEAAATSTRCTAPRRATAGRAWSRPRTRAAGPAGGGVPQSRAGAASSTP